MYPGINVTSVRVKEVVSVDHTMILVEFVTVTVIVVEFVTVVVRTVWLVAVDTVILVELAAATPSTLADEVVVVVARTSRELSNRRAHTNMRAYRARLFMD
jgi:hypothetical protein